jgi:GNAT superfamily N-acetyltransferase
VTVNALRIVSITGAGRDLLEPEWLARAEAVHRQLRPQIPGDYSATMRRIFDDGAEMCIAVEGRQVAGLAVFRMFENTHAGRRFYVDDLVTAEVDRSRGVGRLLLVHLETLARARGCAGLDLESGSQRLRAHRFYFREGLFITGFSFRKEFK